MPERQVLTALIGPSAPLLTVDTADPGALDMTSAWLPRNWAKTTPFLLDDLLMGPLTPSKWNVEISWEIPKLATLMMDLVIDVSIPPSTVLPLGNTAYFVDTLGFALIDWFRMNFGSNQLFSIDPYDLYFKYREYLNTERRDAINQLILGDTTTAQRTNFLQNGGRLIIPLFLPFCLDTACAWPLIALSQKTRFNFKTDTFLNLIQTQAGTTVTQTADPDFNLRVTVVNTTSDEGGTIVAMCMAADGISYMIHQGVRQNSDNIASSQSGVTLNVKLTGMTKPLSLLSWALIPVHLIDNTNRNDKFFFAPNPPPPIPAGLNPYNPIQSWRIEANGQIIQRDVIRDYIRLYKWQEHFPSPPGDEIFFQSYTLQPTSVNASIGYLDYTNLNNPTIFITFGVGGTGIDTDNPGAPQPLRFLVNSQDYNFWFLKSGNASRSFN